MRRFAIRWKNFRSFGDTNWLDIRPITLIIGANASGKTSILAPLLLLKQTLSSLDPRLALKTKGDLFDAGSYKDLITGHDLSKELSFTLKIPRNITETGKELKPIGSYPPGQFEFNFSYSSNPPQPILKRYTVYDLHERIMVQRNLLKSGDYSIRTPKLIVSDEKLRKTIRHTPPEHFLFSLEPVIRNRFEHTLNISDKKLPELTIQHEEQIYLATIAVTNSWIENLLSNISYIGPLRQPPRRLYEVAGEKPLDVGIRGEFTPEILFRLRNTDLMNNVNEWVSRFEFGFSLTPCEIASGIYQINIRRLPDTPEISIADTGFGLSQILPLIVQGYYAGENGMIIAEQPEIHLNPRLQSLLADLFCTIANNKRGVLVETHSEHLLLRLRRLVAEKKIKASQVAIYYVEKHEDKSLIKQVPIEDNGHIAQEAWPNGFFEESLRDSLGLALAQV